MPISFAMLLYVSTQTARHRLSLNAAAYLTRKFISHSLCPEVLARIDPSVQLLSSPLAQLKRKAHQRIVQMVTDRNREGEEESR